MLPSYDRVIEDLQTWDHAAKYLGKEQYYPDFLRFFQSEIESHGWEVVVSEYLLKGGDAADDMLVRLFSGFLHPLIQLMYGLEWKQPAIVAEALAQAAVHGNDIKAFLLESEKLSRDSARQQDQKMPCIVSLLEDVKADEKLANAARMEDSNKIRDGVLKRAKDEIISIASRVRVSPEELDERTAEMFDSCVYMASSAAFHPPNYSKFDFFLM